MMRTGGISKQRVLNAVCPLLGLAYPWLVALGPGVHPALLATSLLVPLAAWLMAHHVVDPRLYPTSRRIAFLTVAAPAIFTFLGGWLDGQQALPFRGTGAWIGLWSVLAVIALLERRHVGGGAMEPVPFPAWRARLRTAHGVSAALLVTFAVLHLGNHAAGAISGEWHKQAMEALRHVYRTPWSEAVLLACVAFQGVSGTLLLWRAATERGDIVRSLQIGSGIYLLFFFASHLSAVMRARLIRGIDTNWDWLTSAPLLTDAWSARLVPYYWLAVIALGIHAGAGLRHVLRAHRARAAVADGAFALVSLGAVCVSTLIMAGLVLASM